MECGRFPNGGCVVKAVRGFNCGRSVKSSEYNLFCRAIGYIHSGSVTDCASMSFVKIFTLKLRVDP